MYYCNEEGFPSLNAREQFIFDTICRSRKKQFRSIEERFEYIAYKSFVDKVEVKRFVFANSKFLSINGSLIQGKKNFFSRVKQNKLYIGAWFRNSQLLEEGLRMTHEAAMIYAFVVAKSKQYGKTNLEVSQQTLCKIIGCTTKSKLKSHIAILERLGLFRYIIREETVYKKRKKGDGYYDTVERACGFFTKITMKSHEATFRTMQIIHQKLGNLREYCKKTGKLCYDEIRGWWLAKNRWRRSIINLQEIWRERLLELERCKAYQYYSCI